ncbi:unnamed protein product [Linum trigynum]|uniref:Uncharacterized protein n=1 Tax=Linum trigynum TaxID=586398 RepID=A0AAV2F654_9ROSI
MELAMALSLRGFTNAHAMWQHLHSIHSQVNVSLKFELEVEIASLQQGDLDVRSYYQVALNLLKEQDMLTTSLVSAAASLEVLKKCASTRLMHFLMKLNPAFEGVHSSLLHRNISTVEEVLAELVRKETRLRSQAKLVLHSSDSGSAFAVQSRHPQFGRNSTGEIIC